MSAARRALFLAALGLGATDATAYETAANQRLDRALYPGHDLPDIVAGRIVAVRRRTAETEEWSPEIVGVDLKVGSVVLGPRDLEGKTLTLDTSSFEWPQGLVRAETGTPCLLVLRRDDTAHELVTVVPSRDQAFEPATDREGAKRILAREVLAALAAERDPGRQRRLIVLAAPILTAEEATVLEPYLGSGDAWLRRAALAGLVHATRRPGFTEFAALDIRRFLETIGPHDMVKDAEEPGTSWAPYGMLLDHYFFLDTGWSDEDRVSDHLPLWRLIAAGMKGDEWTRYRYGVLPLCQVGTEEDLAFLRDYRAAVERGEGDLKPLREKPFVRQQLLLGLARILGLHVPNYVEHDFLAHEAEQARQVTAALEAHDAARAGASR